MAKYSVAYMGAGGVPIAVPVSCTQHVSPNLKTLWRIMMFSANMIASTEMFSTLQIVGLVFVRKLYISESARLFTMDATSMYTNIDTNHALSEIYNFLTNTKPTICKLEDIVAHNDVQC